MKLNELIGIKHLKPNDVNNIEWRYQKSNVRDRIKQWLLDNNYIHFGSGAFADTYSKSGANFIIKIYGYDSEYNKFLQIIKQNPNKHFPVILKHIDVSWQKEIKIVKMEKLYKLDNTDVGILRRIIKNEQNNDNHIDTEKNLAKLDQDDELIKAIHILLNHNSDIDFNPYNFMQRYPDGAIVFIDPWFDKNTIYNKD